ncbi:MAG: FtsQ-type POTRA domain-containing protein [Nitrospira sp.]|nr:FtsQ-type POTRA domain-containing protein [Nitrospira sp.]
MLLGVTVIGVAGWGAMEAYRYGEPIVNDWLQVRDVTVAGTSHVTRQEVLDRLGLRGGETLLSVRVGDLAEQVAAHPWIKHATVRRRFPQTLAVTIVERQPAAVLKVPSGPLLLDDEGRVLTVLAETDEPDLPLLTGIDSHDLMAGEVQSRETARAGIRLAGLLESQFEGRPEVDMGNPENAVVYIQGLRFQFGPSSFEEKWERYRKITTHCTVPGNGCPTLRVSADGGQDDNITHCTDHPLLGPLQPESNGHPKQQVPGNGCPDIDLRYPGKVIVRERG